MSEPYERGWSTLLPGESPPQPCKGSKQHLVPSPEPPGVCCLSLALVLSPPWPFLLRLSSAGPSATIIFQSQESDFVFCLLKKFFLRAPSSEGDILAAHIPFQTNYAPQPFIPFEACQIAFDEEVLCVLKLISYKGDPRPNGMLLTHRQLTSSWSFFTSQAAWLTPSSEWLTFWAAKLLNEALEIITVCLSFALS